MVVLVRVIAVDGKRNRRQVGEHKFGSLSRAGRWVAMQKEVPGTLYEVEIFSDPPGEDGY